MGLTRMKKWDKNISFKEFYEGRRVFITGQTGFKGSWLSLWLSELGARVFGYSLDPPTEPSLYEASGLSQKIHSTIGDIRDLENLRTVLKKSRPEIVFHLAAQPLVRHSYLEPVETYETNVMGTVNLLEACRSTPSVRSIIVITSDKCYENNESNRGYKETDRMGGYDPYSNSKGCAELVVSAYRQSFFNPAEYQKHGVVLASTRAGNVIGGGDWGKDRLLPDCIRFLVQDKTIIIRNPKAIRPWQHVFEPLRGYLLLGQKMSLGGIKYGEGWNFGPSRRGILTVEKVVDKVVKEWGGGSWRNPSTQKEKKLHEAKNLSLNINKAQRGLGWEPLLTFDQNIKLTIEWYKHYYNNSSDILDFSINQLRHYENILLNR
jgi:CDP-glucose 4,6-dehydratase